MASPSTHMFGIRSGGVFSGETDLNDMKKRVKTLCSKLDSVAKKSGEWDGYSDQIGNIIDRITSKELTATKGSCIVIAGVFNYFSTDYGEILAKALSAEFGVEVIYTGWKESEDYPTSTIFLDGKSLYEAYENPVERTVRRIQ